MPPPKPSKSKMVSKRIKKSSPLLFTAAIQEEELPSSQTKRRVRVICTDPDATDSSSDEEAERAPIRPRYTRKRFVCEISLPESSPTSSNENQQEETSMGSASSSSACGAPEERKCFKNARKEVGLDFLYDRSEEPIASPSAESLGECLWADNLGAGLSAVDPSAGLSVENVTAGEPSVELSADNLSAGLTEDNNPSGCLSVDNPTVGLLAENLSVCQFEQFLNEIFSGQVESSIPTWGRDMDLLDDSIFDDPLEFELGFESETWISSVQTM